MDTDSRVSPPVKETQVGRTSSPVAPVSYRAAVSQSVPVTGAPVVATTK